MSYHHANLDSPFSNNSPKLFTRLKMAFERRLINANFDLRQRGERKRSVTELEKLFFDLVRMSTAKLFLEVGAKDAEASRHVAGTQPDNKVIAFEANPYTFSYFNNHFDYKNIGVSYQNIALAEKSGTVKINVRKNNRGKPIADGQASLLKHKTYAPGHIQVDVKASTMNEVLIQNSNNKYALWMDVEGALEPVLKGARQVLQYMQVSFIEVETKEFWSGQWVKSDVDNFLKSAGLIEIARDFQSRRQCNVIYIPQSLSHTAPVEDALKDYRGRIRVISGKPQSYFKLLKNLTLQSRTFKKVLQIMRPRR
jgi:FkbM family methyltransferase